MSDIKKEVVGAIPETLGNSERGYDVVQSSDDAAPITVTLMRIDEAIIHYFDEVILPSVSENDVVRKVPVLYGTPERWDSVRKQGFLRDPQTTKLFSPLIMLRRSSVKRGELQNPNNKYMHYTLDSGYNARNVYDKFAALNNIHPSKQIRQVVIPDYMDLTYEVAMWTEYEEQMNGLIEQVNVESDEYWGTRNNFKFKVQIDEFTSRTKLPAESERVVRVEFTMKVHAYLLPAHLIQNFKHASYNSTAFTPKKVILKETVKNLKND
jgi:hypothetical protein